MPSKHYIDDRSSFVDAPPPSLAVASPLLPGASKGGHYIGTYGRPPMSPLRRPAKARARRSLIVASIRLIQRFAQARRRTRAAIQKANSKARRCAISLGGGSDLLLRRPSPAQCNWAPARGFAGSAARRLQSSSGRAVEIQPALQREIRHPRC